MQSNAFPLQLILGHHFIWTRWTRWALNVVVAGLMIIFPSEVLGQMSEERDRDEPPAERPAGVPEETSPELSAAEQMILSQTNAFRKQQQLDALKPNPKLNETAQDFADFMARTGKYGHTADGKRPSERAGNHRYDYCLVAENIANQFRSTGFTADDLAKTFFSGWKNSPEHRKNMLDPDVTDIGVAVARRSNSPTYLAVQMFGRPQSQAISFQVSNQSDAKVEYTLSRRGSDKTFPLPPRIRQIHQRCRPTKITFSTPDTTLEVEDGAEYVVKRSPDGKLDVSRR
jgi:uncharacterized protein YkwD